MNLKDLSDKDQVEEPYRNYFARYVIAYNILREYGAPEALAIGLVLDFHRISWEHSYDVPKDT